MKCIKTDMNVSTVSIRGQVIRARVHASTSTKADIACGTD